MPFFLFAGVDSSLIRNYVEEALAEIIAIMLRETRAVPTHSLEQLDVQVNKYCIFTFYILSFCSTYLYQ